MTLATNWVDNIGMTVNAAYLNALDGQVNANTLQLPVTDLYANRPAANAVTAGTLFYATDSDKLWRSNGTTWTLIRVAGFGGTALADPPSTGLTNTALGSATFTTDKGDRLLTLPTAAGDNLRLEYKTLSPASNYTATAYINMGGLLAGNYSAYGMSLLDSSGKVIIFGLKYNSGFAITVSKYNSATSFSSDYTTSSLASPQYAPSWWRIRDDGTNRNCEYSFDGFEWTTFYPIGRTDFLTPTQIGWGGTFSATGTQKLRLRSWSIA